MTRWLGNESLHRLQPYRDAGRVDLICDDHQLIQLGVDDLFDQTSLIDSGNESADHVSDQIEQTAFGQLVAAAIDRGLQSDPWSLLWLHSRFLTTCWDAPRDRFDTGFNDHGDFDDEQLEAADIETIPNVFSQTTPPNIKLTKDTHPDLVTSWMATYGCQIQLIDELIAVLLQSIADDDTLVIVAGTSGFSFGQNGWIGHRAGPLRSCHTRVPLIVNTAGPLRWPRLTSADILPELITQLAGGQLPGCSPEAWVAQDTEYSPQLVTRGDHEAAVTTARWFLVRQADQSQHLFVKPDDADDANDVSRLRPDVAETLAESIS